MRDAVGPVTQVPNGGPPNALTQRDRPARESFPPIEVGHRDWADERTVTAKVGGGSVRQGGAHMFRRRREVSNNPVRRASLDDVGDQDLSPGGPRKRSTQRGTAGTLVFGKVNQAAIGSREGSARKKVAPCFGQEAPSG